uniref:HECT domain-containing protein n=1 Tax=Macrostomum lignano TaxID=282301 RepID=A0A1I8F7E9_9PLAT
PTTTSTASSSQSLQRFKPFIDAAVAAHTSDLTESRAPDSTASDAVSHLIREVRAKYASSQSCSSVLVVLNDMPPQSVERPVRLPERRPAVLPEAAAPGVFAVTSGFSFYESGAATKQSADWNFQHLPALVLTATTKLSNHGFDSFGTEEEQEAFRQKAARDWGSFLQARSKELVRGGVLAVTWLPEFCSIAASSTRRSSRTSKFPMCFRTVGDLKEPSQYKRLGLELLRADALPQSDTVYYEDFLQHGDSDGPTYFQSSLTPERSDKDRETVSQQMWGELQTLAASDPERLPYSLSSTTPTVRQVNSNSPRLRPNAELACSTHSSAHTAPPCRLGRGRVQRVSRERGLARDSAGVHVLRDEPVQVSVLQEVLVFAELLRLDDAARTKRLDRLVDLVEDAAALSCDERKFATITPPLDELLGPRLRKLPQSLAPCCLNASCSCLGGRTKSIPQTSTELQLWLLAYLGTHLSMRWDTASGAVESGAAAEVGDHEGTSRFVRSDVWAATARQNEGLEALQGAGLVGGSFCL